LDSKLAFHNILYFETDLIVVTYHDDRGERIESGGAGREADAGEEVLRGVLHAEVWRQ
jgi:hypothetical protein